MKNCNKINILMNTLKSNEKILQIAPGFKIKSLYAPQVVHRAHCFFFSLKLMFYSSVSKVLVFQ